MISYDHSEAPIRARGERGRGNSRKTAIGFRRRFIRVAHRSGNSSGRGETATSNILQLLGRFMVTQTEDLVGRNLSGFVEPCLRYGHSRARIQKSTFNFDRGTSPRSLNNER